MANLLLLRHLQSQIHEFHISALKPFSLKAIKKR